MNDKHIRIRIEQCLTLAKASGCPRRKFGALLLDPERNVILADGYNGGPRGGGRLCAGNFCARDGLRREDLEIGYCENTYVPAMNRSYGEPGYYVYARSFGLGDHAHPGNLPTKEEAERAADELVERFPPIKSGTQVQVGCHHAEMNVICNAAANGVTTRGAWLIVTGEPCLMCAKLIHHAGIVRVLCVKGGFVGGDEGPQYLMRHRVEVTYVEGPQDPRAT